MFYFDPMYMMIMLVTLAFSGLATARVKGAFKKYSKVNSASGKTGAQVAEEILRNNNITDVRVEPVAKSGFSLFGSGDGMLTDHYDPTKKVIRLSPQVFGSTSVAAQAIAAHEVGHAIQHARAYAPLKIRNALVPVAGIGSNFSYMLIFLGIFINAFILVKLGIVLFTAAVLFQIITLPVEFDASNRAKKLLVQYAIISQPDREGVSAVLNAAAWTYVAAAAAAVMNLVYLLFRSGLLGNSRN